MRRSWGNVLRERSCIENCYCQGILGIIVSIIRGISGNISWLVKVIMAITRGNILLIRWNITSCLNIIS